MLRMNKLSLPFDRRAMNKTVTFGAVLALAAVAAGCSAELVRFDSPAFSDANQRAVAVAPKSLAQAPLFEQRGEVVDRGTTNYSGRELGPVARAPRAASVPRGAILPTVERKSAERGPILADAGGDEDQDVRRDVPSNRYTPLTTSAIDTRSITVRAGDTLYKIARDHGVKVRQLRQANGLTGNMIRPGQRLVIPSSRSHNVPSGRGQGESFAGDRTQSGGREFSANERATGAGTAVGAQTYVVQAGDSLYTIARRHNVRVSDLKSLNDIRDVRRIRPGLRLRLRDAGTGRSAPDSALPEQRVATVRRGENASLRASAPSDKPGVGDRRTLPVTRQDRGRDVAGSEYVPTSSNQPQIINRGKNGQSEQTRIARRTENNSPGVAKEPGEKFRWPAQGRIIASFNHSDNGVKNDGINIALPMGTDILASDDGVVAYAGDELPGYGNLVLVRHDNGWVSAYAHADRLTVKRGDKVRRGQVIAKAGRTGSVTQPQLHFELRRGTTPVDPLPYLK